MKARGGLAVLVCAMAVLALPAGAAAKPGYLVIKPSQFSVFGLKGSNGYSIDVISFGPRWVSISASTPPKLPVSFAYASYTVRGKITDDTIEGRFGSRGLVSVRFEPKGKPEVEEVSRGCKGRPSVFRRGRFTGIVRFQGEDGFTRARATSATGFSVRSYRQVCKRPQRKTGSKKRKGPPTVSLSAISSRYPRAPWFSAFKQEPRRPEWYQDEEAEYTVNATERRGGMTIFRSASAAAPLETFAVSPPGASPVTATVAPPAPFSGTATYERTAGSKRGTWSGDLAVDLPGRGTLPLADSTYRAELCRSFACACPIGECFFTSISVVSSRAERMRRLAARIQP